MASDQIDAAVTIDLPRLQMREVLAGRWRCCLNCDNWRESKSICEKFQQRPPTDIITASCPEWFAVGIPF
jgi:hypothetical protein